MIENIKKSMRNINWRLFWALMVMGLCPTVYTTVRTFLLGQLPGEYAFSIAGQLSWVNLLFEVINEAIILPLYFFMGQVINDKMQFVNRVKTGLIIATGVYSVCSVCTIVAINPLLKFMSVSTDILAESASYIRLECIANIFGIMYAFIGVVLVTIGKEKLVYGITFAKLGLSLVLDTFIVSTLPVSLNLGVNGIAISNVISNIILFFVAILMLCKSGYKIFEKTRLSFVWTKEFLKIGGVSGLECLVRNLAYMLMISRMVNVVGAQGTYWVANNFIWGWILLPVLQLGELIKQETAKNKDAVKTNTAGYFCTTTIICLLWVVCIPLYKPFMKYVLNFSDVNELFNLVMVLFVFYIFFAFQNVFDATFYGRGKVNYMLCESVVTNSVYYGICFILYKAGIFVPSLTGIALMFGLGNAFDAIVSGIAYKIFLKKEMS